MILKTIKTIETLKFMEVQEIRLVKITAKSQVTIEAKALDVACRSASIIPIVKIITANFFHQLPRDKSPSLYMTLYPMKNFNVRSHLEIFKRTNLTS